MVLTIASNLSTRTGLTEVKGVVKPFDWTYTTDYKGSLFSEGQHKLEVRSSQTFIQMYCVHGNYTQVIETSERIDIEKLKAPEKIHFFDEIVLYEDELHDNGCAVLNVKVVCTIDYAYVFDAYDIIACDGQWVPGVTTILPKS